MVDRSAYAFGTRPRYAAALVAVVAVVETAALVLLGTLGGGSAAADGRSFGLVFGVVLAVAGTVGGSGRLGYPAAVAAGLSPGAAFYVVVAVGASLGVAGFGGGDSPLLPFATVLGSASLVWATAGFCLGVGAAAVAERRRG